MGSAIPDFSAEQLNAVQQLINARYCEETVLQLGDSEVQIYPDKEDISLCPIVFWNARDCNFVVIRTGENQYRAQYFYNPRNQFSTRQPMFTDAEDCVSAVLREQSNYEREVAGIKDGATATDID